MNYMAKCPTDDCSVWKGDEGDPWFKIQQEVYSNGVWASDAVANNNATSTVTIPKNIKAGSYVRPLEALMLRLPVADDDYEIQLLRHEILALHGGGSLGGAQFYPVCVQLTGESMSRMATSLPALNITHFTVTGGGSLAPSGLSFPGAYNVRKQV